MTKLNVIFKEEITPRDNNFNDGKPFREVTFENVKAWNVAEGCLWVVFNDQEYTPYIYPLHTISRIKAEG